MPETPCTFINPGFEEDMEEQSSNREAVSDYSHAKSMEQVDQMRKELDELKATLVKNRVKCHMLEVDLATQFSPYMVDMIRTAQLNCKSCTEAVKEKSGVSIQAQQQQQQQPADDEL